MSRNWCLYETEIRSKGIFIARMKAPCNKEGSMAKKSFEEIASEMHKSVELSPKKERRLKSSTFWRGAFRIKRKTDPVIERVKRILTEQNLRYSVKSGDEFGKEKTNDWIVLTVWPPYGGGGRTLDSQEPSDEWFEKIKTRKFESEREVEYYFIMPLLEKLGYEDDDVAVGYPVVVFEGVKQIKKEADVVLFNGSNREIKDVLLVIEAKDSDKEISVSGIGQAKFYAKELLPACYVITNGQKVLVFQFNGMLYQDELVVDFDRSMLKERWDELYNYISKEAAIDRKRWREGIR